MDAAIIARTVCNATKESKAEKTAIWFAAYSPAARFPGKTFPDVRRR
jgi:hypothetical protein